MGTVGHTALHEDVTQESTNAAHVRSNAAVVKHKGMT